MGLYTDRNYPINDAVVKKLDRYCERCSDNRKLQNVIVIDGMEGYGKSTLGSTLSYYMAWKLQRRLVLFFDIDKLTEFAIHNEDCIIVWDDAAFAALSMSSYSQAIIKLIQVLLLARKKRHTYFINIQEIAMLKKPIVRRAIGLFHVFSKDEIQLGKYMYFRKAKLQRMWDNWLKKNRMEYHKYKTLGRCDFGNDLAKIFNEEEYESLKDDAILSLSSENSKPVGKQEAKEIEWKYRITLMPEKLGIQQKDMLEILQIERPVWWRWANKIPFSQNTTENPSKQVISYKLQEITKKGFIEPSPLDGKNSAIKRKGKWYKKMKKEGKINEEEEKYKDI